MKKLFLLIEKFIHDALLENKREGLRVKKHYLEADILLIDVDLLNF
jgi:hypothetical protein